MKKTKVRRSRALRPEREEQHRQKRPAINLLKEGISKRLRAVVEEGILERTRIHTELNGDSLSIASSSCQNHILTRGHTIPVRDPVTKEIYHLEHLGDMVRGTGVSKTTGIWPFKKTIPLPVSMKVFLDFQGHGTKARFADAKEEIAVSSRNEQLFESNLRVRHITQLLLNYFAENMRHPAHLEHKNMHEFLVYAGEMIDKEIAGSAGSDKNHFDGVQFASGKLFGTRRLALRPGEKINPNSHFVEFTYLSGGDIFYLVQGDKVQLIEKGKSFNLKHAGQEFAENYNCNAPSLNMPGNNPFGLNLDFRKQLEPGQFIFKAGHDEPACMLISFTDGVTEQPNAKGDMLEHAVNIPAKLGEFCKSSQFHPKNVAFAIDELVNQFRGNVHLRDDMTILTERLV